MGIAVYVIATLTCTIVWMLLSARLADQTGLRRQVWAANDFPGRPVIDDVSPAVNLDFLDDDPRFPQQFFSARWRGYWYVPNRQSITVHVQADDSSDIWIDGTRHFAESSAAARTIALDAGVHELRVDYQQQAGAFHLGLYEGSGGAYPQPLQIGHLFPRQPEPGVLQLASIVDRLSRSAFCGYWVLSPPRCCDSGTALRRKAFAPVALRVLLGVRSEQKESRKNNNKGGRPQKGGTLGQGSTRGIIGELEGGSEKRLLPYQRTRVRPSTLLSLPLSSGLSHRCASTPSSKCSELSAAVVDSEPVHRLLVPQRLGAASRLAPPTPASRAPKPERRCRPGVVAEGDRHALVPEPVGLMHQQHAHPHVESTDGCAVAGFVQYQLCMRGFHDIVPVHPEDVWTVLAERFVFPFKLPAALINS